MFRRGNSNWGTTWTQNLWLGWHLVPTTPHGGGSSLGAQTCPPFWYCPSKPDFVFFALGSIHLCFVSPCQFFVLKIFRQQSVLSFPHEKAHIFFFPWTLFSTFLPFLWGRMSLLANNNRHLLLRKIFQAVWASCTEEIYHRCKGFASVGKSIFEDSR